MAFRSIACAAGLVLASHRAGAADSKTPAPIHVVVAQDGSGDFKTIQQAVDHAPITSGTQRIIVEIRPGTYHERYRRIASA